MKSDSRIEQALFDSITGEEAAVRAVRNLVSIPTFLILVFDSKFLIWSSEGRNYPILLLQYAPPLENRLFRQRLGVLISLGRNRVPYIGFSVEFLSRHLKMRLMFLSAMFLSAGAYCMHTSPGFVFSFFKNRLKTCDLFPLFPRRYLSLCSFFISTPIACSSQRHLETQPELLHSLRHPDNEGS